MYIQINLEADHLLESAGTFSYPKGRLHANRRLPYHVLLYVEQGGWDIRFGDHTFTMKAGDVVWMPADIPHFGVSPCQAGTKGLYLHCFPCPGDRLVETATANEGITCLPPVITAMADQAVHRIFTRLVETFSSALPHRERLCRSLLDALVVELSYCQPIPFTPLHHRVDNLLNQHPDRFLSNGELGALLHLSPKTLERRFKAEVGKTLHRYQTDRKIESAKKMLITLENITLCEIALMLGFYDAAHFSHVFKKAIGVSPEHYRQQALQT